MSLLQNRDFVLGFAFLLFDLIRIYANQESERWCLAGNIAVGFGLGLVCVSIFEAPRISIVFIMLLWIMSVRQGYYLEKS